VSLHEFDDAPTEIRPLEVDVQETALEAIRRRREEHTAEQVYDMVVPGYRGCLVLRCAPLAGDSQTRARMRMEKMERQKNPMRDFALNADTLLDVVEEVLVRRSRDLPLEPIDPSGEPRRLDTRLAELLQVSEEAPTLRLLVRAIFDQVPSPEIAVGVAVSEYLSWAQGVDADADEDLLGES